MRSTSQIEWELALTDKFKQMYQPISMDKLKILQDTYYDMFCKFDKLCEEYQLKSYMVAGTLIGAVRHDGFIPWDDDIDLVMFRDDYEKLKKVFKENADFILVDPAEDDKGIHKMLKLQSKSITLHDVLGEGFSKDKYLYLDMLPIDFVPESKISRKIKGMCFKVLDLSYSSARCFKKYSPHLDYMAKSSPELKKNLLIRKIVGFPAMLVGPSKVFRMMENLLKGTKKSSQLTIAYGVKGYFGETVDFNTFYPGKKLYFEKQEFWAPEDSHAYLSNRYGDYMKIPDKKEQLERHVRLRDDWKETIIEEN